MCEITKLMVKHTVPLNKTVLLRVLGAFYIQKYDPFGAVAEAIGFHVVSHRFDFHPEQRFICITDNLSGFR